MGERSVRTVYANTVSEVALNRTAALRRCTKPWKCFQELAVSGRELPPSSRLQHERDIESVEAINEAIARANLILKGCIMGQ